jgi:hypothetical protein
MQSSQEKATHRALELLPGHMGSNLSFRGVVAKDPFGQDLSLVFGEVSEFEQ